MSQRRIKYIIVDIYTSAWKVDHSSFNQARPLIELCVLFFAAGVEAPGVAILGGTVAGTLVLLTLRGDRLVTVWQSGALDSEAEGGGGGVGEGRAVTALHATALPPLTPAQVSWRQTRREGERMLGSLVLYMGVGRML